MSTPTIAEFISARLDEWEQAAREATPGPWVQTGIAGSPWNDLVDSPGAASVVAETDTSDENARHIALHDPAATLALVAALRAVVAEHDVSVGFIVSFCRACDTNDYPCRTLRHLAVAWADHPEYDGSWAL